MWKLIVHLPDRYLIGMVVWLCTLALLAYVLLRLRRRWKANVRWMRLVKAGLGLWSLAGFLTILELGFVLFYDTTDSFDMTNVSRRWYGVHVQPDLKILPFKNDGAYTFRDDVEYPLRPSTTATHILFLGDSFTFGHGVADVRNRFSNQIRTRLQADPATRGKFVVSNLSKPGSDLNLSEALLQSSLEDQNRVDVAVHVMCLNDIEEFHADSKKFNVELEQLRKSPPTFLLRETYFFNWAYFRYRLLTRNDLRNYYSFVNEYYSGPAWTKFVEKLDRISALCHHNDIRFVLVIFPFLHNLGPDYPFEAAHAQIAAACHERNIVCLDLLPVLRSQADKRLTVNAFDAHPNERAHGIVAEELHRQINLLSPQPVAP